MRTVPRVLLVGVAFPLLAVLAGCTTTASPPSPTAAPPAKPAATSAPAPAPAAGATTAPAPAASGKRLVIGFTASETGAQNVTSKKQIEGLKLWLDDVNRGGGIKLKDGTVFTPEMKSYDDESKTDRVQALYTKLIQEDRVDFLISPYSSGLAKAAAVVSEQNGKVMITTGAADDATMEQGFKRTYQLYTPGSRYLPGAIDMLKKLDSTARKIAIIYEKDAFSTSVAQAAQPYARQQGFDVVMYEGYDSGTTDFAPFINKITALAPDAIIGGGHFQDGTTFAKQLYEKRLPVRFVTLLVAPPEPTFIEIGDAAQNIIGPSQWEPKVTYHQEAARAANLPWFGISVKDFVAEYKAKYNTDPSYHSAGGYAAGLILQKAIEDAGSIDPAKVSTALDQMNVMTFYGAVKFSTEAKTHGKQIAHEMTYMQWQKDATGKLVSEIVGPPDAKSADPLLRK